MRFLVENPCSPGNPCLALLATRPPVPQRRVEEGRLSRAEVVAVSRGFRHSAGASVFTLTTFLCPRSSNPACSFPALGSRSKSCIRPRKPDRPPTQARALHALPQVLVQAAHEFPDFALCFRRCHRRSGLLVCSSPPLRSGSAPLPTRGAKDWNELLRHSRIPRPPPTALRSSTSHYFLL